MLTYGQNLENGTALHERFVQESRKIDQAHLGGTLNDWIKQKLNDERQAAFNRPASSESSGSGISNGSGI